MRDKYDLFEQGSMTVEEYEACVYALYRYSIKNITTISEKIRKSIMGLDISI